MRSPLVLLLCAATALLLHVDPAGAQTGGGLALRVTDHATSRPLRDAQIVIPSLRIGARADSTGIVLLSPIPVGTHVVEISALGYTTERVAIEFTRGGRAEGEVALVAAPVLVEGVETEGRRTDRILRVGGLQQRAISGMGSYLYGERLAREQRGTAFLSDLLRDMRGVRIVPTQNGRIAVASRGAATILGSGTCVMPVYLNGAHVPVEDLDSLVSVDELAGIEVYAGPSETPIQWSHPCGAILLWTRTG